jgi:hypothetical protein
MNNFPPSSQLYERWGRDRLYTHLATVNCSSPKQSILDSEYRSYIASNQRHNSDV